MKIVVEHKECGEVFKEDNSKVIQSDYTHEYCEKGGEFRVIDTPIQLDNRLKKLQKEQEEQKQKEG